jgi:hypothetical protein
MRAFLSRIVPVVVACSVVAACETTSPNPAEENAEKKVEELLGELTAVAEAAGKANTLGGGAATPPIQFGSNCPFNNVSKFFVCPIQVFDGITMNVSYQLLDGSNVAQESFDQNTTAAVRVVSDMHGTRQVSSGGINASQTMADHFDWTISGLLNNDPKLNGTGFDTATIVVEGGPTWSITATQTMANLILPSPQDSTIHWPLGGSITMESVQTPQGSPPLNVKVKTIFNGSSVASIELTLNGNLQVCTMDLANPSAGPVCPQPPGPPGP